MIHTPVAFFIFNRPGLTAKVFEQIRIAQPQTLFVIADGPRAENANDAQQCQRVREIIKDGIDWPCQVFEHFAEKNMGCRDRVSSGLDWVFQQVDRAIVLEDDCLPVPSFFSFCEELLERYKNDTRIMQICGNNVAEGNYTNEFSYAYSKIGPIWGWASWRRAWKHYDVKMKAWPQVVKEKLYQHFWDLSDEVHFRFPLYEDVYNNRINTWDIQWGFTKFLHSGVSIIPKHNLISNIGFGGGEEATHTNATDHPLAQLPCHELNFPLQHPPYLVRDKSLEQGINEMLSGKRQQQAQHHPIPVSKIDSPNIAAMLPPIKVGFLTSRGVNVGDEFIREGIRAILERLNLRYTPLYVHKLSESSLYTPDEDEVVTVRDKYWDCDLFIQGGAPVYWHLLNGQATSLNSEWHQWMWEERILKEQKESPVFINLGAGSCQPWGDMGDAFLQDADCVQFAAAASNRAFLTTVRDPVAARILNELQLPHEAVPCPAFLAACRHPRNAPVYGVIGVNLMPLGAHYDLSADFDTALWQRQCFALLTELRRAGKLIFIAHDQTEADFMAKFAIPGERIFLSGNWRDYFDMYSTCSVVVANRVHGAVCAAGFGVPAIILGNDTRAMIGNYIDIPRYHVSNLNVAEVAQKVRIFLKTRDDERSRLLELRDETLLRYERLLAPVIDQLNASRQHVMIDRKKQAFPLLSLASVVEIHSKTFVQFMERLNTFAAKHSLRTFTNWSKVWEYPWIWFHGLASMEWSNARLLDFGSEISPMPWVLASLGAQVTMVETDPQWIPVWEKIKQETGLPVDWRIISDEYLPFADESFDVVTSFSVIEHQPDKVRAVDEVARVLKHGGTFGISFDICEPAMGMTFPEWNGRALTMQEFEEIIWKHSAFDTGESTPRWNVENCPEFLQWHLQSAPHHNYVVGAAIIKKKRAI